MSKSNNIINKNDIQKLALAIIKQNYNEVSVLLDRGISPNQTFNILTDAAGYNECTNINNIKSSVTPLMLASSIGEEKIAKLLIQKGARVDERDNEGYTSLMIATIKGHINIVQLLLENTANPYITNNLGENVVYLATKYDHPELLNKFIFDRFNLDCAAVKEPFGGATPLIFLAKNPALSKHSLDSIKLLIKAGANIEHKDKDGMTALSYAIKNNHEEMVEHLIKAGADLNWQGLKGEDYLSLAIAVEKSNLVEKLLNAGMHAENKHLIEIEHQLHCLEVTKHGDSYDFLEISAGNITESYLPQINSMVKTKILQREYNRDKEQEGNFTKVGAISPHSIKAEETSLAGGPSLIDPNAINDIDQHFHLA